MILKLYGMISKIHKDGVVSRCEPIFVEDSPKKITNFYKIENENLVQVDLKDYGNPVFLPAARKKIDDGNEYFVVYRPSQDVTKGDVQRIIVEAKVGDDDAFFGWLPPPKEISVGIKFPDGFIATFKKGLTSDMLAKYVKNKN